MITVQRESFFAALPELSDIWPEHHAELAVYKDRMPVAWNYEDYLALEKAGRLLLMTVRWDKKIVAYYLAHLTYVSRYALTPIAKMDLVYVRPSVRGKGLILPLLRAVEKELKRSGIKLWFSGYKTANHLGMPDIYQRFGFEPCDTLVSKWIGD